MNNRPLSHGVLLGICVCLGCRGEVAGQPPPTSSKKSTLARANARAPAARAKARPPAAPVKRVFTRRDFDLRANLPLAHLHAGGLVADASRYGLVKYLRDMERRWKLGEKEAGRPAAFPFGRQAQLWLPLGPELAGQPLAVELQLNPVGKQRLALYVAGQLLGQHELTGGWQRVRVDLPDGLIKAPGFVPVRLYLQRARSHAGTRTCAALRVLRIGPRSAPPLPLEEPALARVLPRAAGDDLLLPDGGGLDYVVTPVKGLRLKGAVRGGELEVLTHTDGEKPRRLVRSRDRLDVSLDALAGKAVRLMLRARGGEVRLSNAGLVAGGKVPPIKPRKPRYVIFWLIDALRADKLSFYGKRGSVRPKVKTPNITAIAKEGAVFDPFWTTSNESKAGHASYWTGTYPAVHHVLTHAAKLKDHFLTLAEAFKEAGYATAAFVSNGFISKRWNYVQGFDHVTNFIREEKPNHAGAVVDTAVPWIDRQRGKPFYLFLGTSDTHVSYRVHKRFIKEYDKEPYHGPFRRYVSGKTLGKIKGRRQPPPLRERQRIEAIYENEAAFNDMHFGRLIAHLKQKGLLDQTMFIINSDHGEEFWEHGSCGHGHSLYRELISVPFVLRFPGVIPPARVTTGHDGADLLPTVLALLDRKPPADVQGESLLPYINTAPAYPRATLASDQAWSYAVRAGPAKVILRSHVAIDVFDLAKDPREQHDVFRTRMVLALAGLDPLSLFVGRPARWHKATWGVPNNLTRAFPLW